MTTLLCFSHLRWNFVYQRPQHLMSRFAKVYRTFYFEEPVFIGEATDDYIDVQEDKNSAVTILTPMLTNNHADPPSQRLRVLLDRTITNYNITDFIAWYYTPLALEFTDHLVPSLTVYDCMDELSAFKNASPEIPYFEEELFKRSDIVFTGGYSLYEAKKGSHKNIYPFPSSVDKRHFMRAREVQHDPIDQAEIPHPRIGFFGVLDERLDIALLKATALLLPDWHFIMIGPTVKIDPQDLPVANNIHYLGGKTYDQLPSYLAGWDIAFIPFAQNESTRYISPTKTPEFLAGGRPVIATPIVDIVQPYGEAGLVAIAATPEEVAAAVTSISNNKDEKARLTRVDDFLKDNSWENTFYQMYKLMHELVGTKKNIHTETQKSYV